MDKTELVNEQVIAGAKLIEALDESNFNVASAMWFYLSDNNEWRLIIASPYVDKNGPMKSYELIQDKLDEIKNHITVVTMLQGDINSFISLQNISVVSPNDDLIKLVRTAIKTKHNIGYIRFTKNVINNILIEDALIYRMT